MLQSKMPMRRELILTADHDIEILIGDFNATIDTEAQSGSVTDQHSLHQITSPCGERLCQLATMQKYIISRTFFPHRKIQKDACYSIIHVLVSRRWAISEKDVRA